MTAAAILVVVVAGFLFTSRYPLAKFKQIRSSGWAFYLHAFSWGTIFCFLSAILLLVADYGDWLVYFAKIWNIDLNLFLNKIQSDIIHIKWLTWAVSSLILAWLFGFITTQIPTNHQKASCRVAQENEFEQLLFDAAHNNQLVLVTLTSRKVYAGFVLQTLSLDNLNKTEFFSLLPLFSGYREKDTLSLNLPTNYERFYNSLDDQDNNWEKLRQFRVILPSNQVAMISYFDLKAHEEISKNPPEPIITSS